MRKKDTTITENCDRGELRDNEQETVQEQSLAASGQIKNAHASGDGSYGRNDESVPEEENAPAKNVDNNY